MANKILCTTGTPVSSRRFSHLVLCPVVLVFLLCLSFSAKCDEAELFEKFNIPKEARRKPIALFLERVDWQLSAFQSGNWLKAACPPFRKREKFWSNFELEYYYPYDFERKEYRVTDLSMTYFGPEHPDLGDPWSGFVIVKPNGGILSCMERYGYFTSVEGMVREIGFTHRRKFPEVEEPGCIKWDTEGNRTDDYHKNRLDFWEDFQLDESKQKRIYREDELEMASQFLALESVYKPFVPDVPKDKKVFVMLNDVVSCYENMREGTVSKLMGVPGFDDRKTTDIYLKFRFFDKALVTLFVCQLRNEGNFGRSLTLDDEGRIARCQIGWIEVVEEEIDHQTVGCPIPKYRINGNGVEIRFHPTGYPACYKTIVRNRLFGRQLEWNEKGELLSDVDLDIPQPWPDAPKTEEDK